MEMNNSNASWPMDADKNLTVLRMSARQEYFSLDNDDEIKATIVAH